MVRAFPIDLSPRSPFAFDDVVVLIFLVIMDEPSEPDLTPYMKALSEAIHSLNDYVRKILNAQLQILDGLLKLSDSLAISQTDLLKEVLSSNQAVLKALEDFSQKLGLPPSKPSSSPSSPQQGGRKVQ